MSDVPLIILWQSEAPLLFSRIIPVLTFEFLGEQEPEANSDNNRAAVGEDNVQSAGISAEERSPSNDEDIAATTNKRKHASTGNSPQMKKPKMDKPKNID